MRKDRERRCSATRNPHKGTDFISLTLKRKRNILKIKKKETAIRRITKNLSYHFKTVVKQTLDIVSVKKKLFALDLKG